MVVRGDDNHGTSAQRSQHLHGLPYPQFICSVRIPVGGESHTSEMRQAEIKTRPSGPLGSGRPVMERPSIYSVLLRRESTWWIDVPVRRIPEAWPFSVLLNPFAVRRRKSRIRPPSWGLDMPAFCASSLVVKWGPEPRSGGSNGSSHSSGAPTELAHGRATVSDDWTEHLGDGGASWGWWGVMARLGQETPSNYGGKAAWVALQVEGVDEGQRICSSAAKFSSPPGSSSLPPPRDGR